MQQQFSLPIGAEDDFEGIIDLVEMQASSTLMILVQRSEAREIPEEYKAQLKNTVKNLLKL
jgi:elongation factor G